MNKSDRPFFAKLNGTFVIILLLILVIGEARLPVEKNNVSKKDVLYSGAFVKINADNSAEEISVPGKYKVPKGEKMIIETILPEGVSEKDMFCYNSIHQSVYVYLKEADEYKNASDGQLIYSYDTTNELWFGNNSASRYLMIPMDESMSGKVLRIVSVADAIYSGQIREVYFGREFDIWSYIASFQGIGPILAIIILTLGILIVISCEILRVTYTNKMISLTYLGWSAIANGCWILFESRFRTLIFDNASLTANIAYLIMFIFPQTVLLFVNDMQEYRYNRLHKITQTVLFSGMILSIVMHLAKVADLVQTMLFSYAIGYLAITIVLVTVIIDIVRKQISDYKYAVIGYIILYATCIYELVVDLKSVNQVTGLYMGIGDVIFLLLAIYNVIIVILAAEGEKNKAVALGEAKSQFLANMSHEIRTPINAILGMNEMILRENIRDSVREYAMNIESSGNLLLYLINDILDFSKIEAGKMQIIPVDYKLSLIINDLYNALKPKADNKNLDFILNINPEIPEYLHGDEIRIKQIVINLLNNAVKYTDSGKVELNVTYEKTNVDMIYLRFEVSDTGKGIKKENLGKIFDSFKRVEDNNNRSIEGTGLGLSITSSLVELMGGEINVSSVFGEGSVFTVNIPQWIIKNEPIGNIADRNNTILEKRSEYKESFHAPNARILIVDDNDTNLMVAKHLLKETRIVIDTAASGESAIELIGNNLYDLVLLDHMMPEMDGIETLRIINEKYPVKSFPVIALTANAIVGAKDMYLENGFEDYMSKPVTGEALERMLLKWLPRHVIEKVDDNSSYAPEISYENIVEQSAQVSLPKLEGFDWEKAVNTYGYDEDVILMTAKSIYDNLDDSRSQLEALYADYQNTNSKDALDGIRVKVHAIKSSTAMIGADISEDAKSIEFAIRDNNLENLDAKIIEFIFALDDMKKKLETLLDMPEEAEIKPAYTDYTEVIINSLTQIAIAMESFDVDVADREMKNIRSYSYPYDLAEHIIELEKAVAGMDDDKAAEIVEKIMEMLD